MPHCIYLMSPRFFLAVAVSQTSTGLITVGVDLDHLAEVVSVRFLLCKVALLLPLFMFSSLERSNYAWPTLKEWGVMFYPLEGGVSM